MPELVQSRCWGLGWMSHFLGTKSLLLHDFPVSSGSDLFFSSLREADFIYTLISNKGENHLLRPSDPNLHGGHLTPFPDGAAPLSD